MEKKRRGQASLESMFVMGVLVMIFLLLGYTVYKNFVKTADLKLHIAGSRLSKSLADRINDLNALADGYSSHYSLPQNLVGGGSYTVDFYDNDSTVFIEGGSFSTGDKLTFSSPISTSRVMCILPQCGYTCNKTSSDQCLNVTDDTELRLVKYSGKIYLTPPYNVIQDGVSTFVSPFEGNGEFNLSDPKWAVSPAQDSTGDWNTLLVYHNMVNDTFSVVWNMNLTGAEIARMRVGGLLGKLAGVRSLYGGAQPEFDLTADPQGQWISNGSADVHGASIIFKGGFNVCITPEKDNMPPEDWVFLDSNGEKIILEKDKNVCISYP